MRYIIFIFIILTLITSIQCGTNRAYEKQTYYDTIYIYSDSDGDGFPYFINDRPEPLKSYSRTEPKVLDKYNITNYIDTTFDTTNIIDYRRGIIAYNIPYEFNINKWNTIKLRISQQNKVEYIVTGKGNRPIPIVDNIDDEIIVDKIKIDENMSAKLYSDNNVDVYLVTSEVQRISEYTYTEWVWRVRPNTPDKCYIKLIVTMSDVDHVVYEELIPVNHSKYWKFFKWIARWWQAITATIITPILIPFIIWLLKRRKYKQ